ncbi:MAG: DUF4190 domain-containing protein [Clostridia bacterium]|nr:DUF4190 domain-containing protein [Clostridia bacterium]
MGIASFVLGIISLVMGWIPFVCFFTLMTAVIGLIFGIIDTIKKSKTNDKNKGFSIAGLIISAISIPIILIMSIISIAIIVEDTEPNDIYNRYYYDDYDYDDDYDDWLDDWYDNYYHRDRIHDYKSF